MFLPNGDSFFGEWKDGRLDCPVNFAFGEKSRWNDPEF